MTDSSTASSRCSRKLDFRKDDIENYIICGFLIIVIRGNQYTTQVIVGVRSGVKTTMKSVGVVIIMFYYEQYVIALQRKKDKILTNKLANKIKLQTCRYTYMYISSNNQSFILTSIIYYTET